MRVFLYEYLTGGGTWDGRLGDVPSGSLLREGTAMITALATDFARSPGVEVHLLCDARLSCDPFDEFVVREIHSDRQERDAFCELASVADATVVIAPEFDGILWQRCRWAEDAGARLLSPSAAFVAVAGDKQATATQLAGAGVPTPPACPLAPGDHLPPAFAYPAVLKPPDGAGSMDTRQVADAGEAGRLGPLPGAMRLERFCPGIPASVSVLCGPGLRLPLPAGRQLIAKDGTFRYLGGQLPLPADLCRRAQQLAVRALEALPAVVGYVGVDVILGAASNGDEDAVLEVNPRLTTSYVGLRRLCRDNLATAMLAIARGEMVQLSWHDQMIRFDADGRFRREPSADLHSVRGPVEFDALGTSPNTA